MRMRTILLWHGRVLAGSLAIGGLCALASPPVSLAEPSADAAPEAQANKAVHGNTAKPGTAGRWIHVDPETGKVGPPPRGGSPLSAALRSAPAFSTSHEGLVEVPAPGGGFTVDLQGRFRHAAVARLRPDGKVVTECVRPGAPVREK